MERGVVGRYAEAGWKTRVSEQLCVLVLSMACVCVFVGFAPAFFLSLVVCA